MSKDYLQAEIGFFQEHNGVWHAMYTAVDMATMRVNTVQEAVGVLKAMAFMLGQRGVTVSQGLPTTLKLKLVDPKDFEDFESPFRVCSECGVVFDEGYVLDDGEDYYCSAEHMDAHRGGVLRDSVGDDDLTTEELVEQLYSEDRLYWTNWEA